MIQKGVPLGMVALSRSRPTLSKLGGKGSDSETKQAESIKRLISSAGRGTELIVT